MLFAPRIPSISAEALAEALQGDNPPLLLDVREAGEVARESLAGAVHIPLALLPLRVNELPIERPIAAVCVSGGRSAHATAFLVSEGYEAVNVRGGLIAMREHGW